jgi:hypothetical protein
MHLITGGGIVQNNNSVGGDEPELLAIGGFVAKATGEGETETDWTARGQIQAKIFDTADPTNTLSMLHGRVVCIAQLDENFWEIRFQVTRSAGVFPVEVDQYGSLFVQDNGKPGTEGPPDMADESFDKADDPTCGLDLSFGLEPVIAGNFTVH